MGKQSGVRREPSGDDMSGKTPMQKDREAHVEYENIDQFREVDVDIRGNTPWSGFHQDGAPDENMLTVEEAMMGVVSEGYQGGSGGTGGPLTGELTNGGETQDLTAGYVGDAKIGGPTGGDVYGAGKNPDSFKDDIPPREDVISVGSREETEEELARRIADENATELLKHKTD